jgi:hypothetical protein
MKSVLKSSNKTCNIFVTTEAQCVVRNLSTRHVSSVPRPWSRPEGLRGGGREVLPRAPLNSVHGLMIDRLTITYKVQVYQLLPVLVMKVHGYSLIIYLRTVKDDWTSFKTQILRWLCMMQWEWRRRKKSRYIIYTYTYIYIYICVCVCLFGAGVSNKRNKPTK